MLLWNYPELFQSRSFSYRVCRIHKGLTLEGGAIDNVPRMNQYSRKRLESVESNDDDTHTRHKVFQILVWKC